MKTFLRILLTLGPVLVCVWTVTGQTPAGPRPLPEGYSCTLCHADTELFFSDQKRGRRESSFPGGKSGFYRTRWWETPAVRKDRASVTESRTHLLVTEKDLTDDIHWQKDLHCHDCHGGSPDLAKFKDHRKDPGFHRLDFAKTCIVCHSDEKTTTGTPMKKHHLFVTVGLPGCTVCHGHHDIRTASEQTLTTAKGEGCIECHSKKEYKKLWNDWTKGGHKGLECEACHGPAGDHALPDVDPRPKMAVTSEMLAEPHVLCMVCHAEIPERQTSIRQIDCEKHLAEFKVKKGEPEYEEARQCLTCHDAHRPVKK